jgi:hypothetical protein
LSSAYLFQIFLALIFLLLSLIGQDRTAAGAYRRIVRYVLAAVGAFHIGRFDENSSSGPFWLRVPLPAFGP